MLVVVANQFDSTTSQDQELFGCQMGKLNSAQKNHTVVVVCPPLHIMVACIVVAAVTMQIEKKKNTKSINDAVK